MTSRVGDLLSHLSEDKLNLFLYVFYNALKMTSDSLSNFFFAGHKAQIVALSLRHCTTFCYLAFARESDIH